MAMQPYVRPPTIHDVARVAKLSKSTVSNVIRNAVGVHPTTRERVQAAIIELGYQTNIVARQLVQQRTTILGIVIGDLTNPFHAEMAKLIEDVSAAQGYQVMFCNARSDRDPDLDGIRRMLEHRVAGLIFLSCKAAAERARHLIGGRVPAVFVSCSGSWGDVVSVDERAGARAATSHLIAEGHRRIWHLAEDAAEGLGRCERHQGYLDAMTVAGLSPTTLCVGRDGALALVDGVPMLLAEALAGEDGPTAIFAVNDAHALRMMGLAETLGVSVPDHLSVFGFDDAACASHVRLQLTTVAQPKEQLSQLAVETLVRRVGGGPEAEPSRQLLGFQLVVRQSTAAPGQARESICGFPSILTACARPSAVAMTAPEC